ncbi:MAG: hypothetical protein BM556_09025 [Bacteriovorax sp. MedPE-SWde]|nr:MAG: hypothetical protein BM556_09025 [Bacteriovorax sp. MedPE-SWde]
MKKVIINADDFGVCAEVNQAIILANSRGVLSSATILTNGDHYDEAINIAKQRVGKLGIGVHLNLTDGKSLSEEVPICSSEKILNLNFGKLLFLQFSPKIRNSIEAEYRKQIEKLMASGVLPDHVDSHNHSHSIPLIFNIAAKLCKEYGIPGIRLPRELFDRKPAEPLNIVKVLIVNIFSVFNRFSVKRYGLKTTNSLIGISHTGNMCLNAIKHGMNLLRGDNISVEIITHPSTAVPSGFYLAKTQTDFLNNENRISEFEALVSPEIKDFLDNKKFKLSRFSDL